MKQETYKEISYEELGDYVGRKAIIQVNKKWLDLIMRETGGAKECSKCKEILPIDEFNNDKRRRFGKRSQCKSCYSGTSPDTTDQPKSKTKPTTKEQIIPKIEYTITNL